MLLDFKNIKEIGIVNGAKRANFVSSVKKRESRVRRVEQIVNFYGYIADNEGIKEQILVSDFDYDYDLHRAEKIYRKLF